MQAAFPQLFDRQVFRKVAGFKHYMALTATGGLYSWGKGSDGQLGAIQPLRNSGKESYCTHQKHESTYYVHLLCDSARYESAHTFDCAPGFYPVSRDIH